MNSNHASSAPLQYNNYLLAGIALASEPEHHQRPIRGIAALAVKATPPLPERVLPLGERVPLLLVVDGAVIGLNRTAQRRHLVAAVGGEQLTHELRHTVAVR